MASNVPFPELHSIKRDCRQIFGRLFTTLFTSFSVTIHLISMQSVAVWCHTYLTDCIDGAPYYIFVFPPCRRASPAAVKETSMTDLENKAENTPSTQTAPAHTDKPEVDLPKPP